MAKFISGLAIFTWIAGVLGAIICFTSDSELFIAGFGVLVAAGVQGALLYALSMILTNTETTVAQCDNLKNQLNTVQEKLKNLENQSSAPAGVPVYKAAGNPSKSQVTPTVSADAVHVKPIVETKSSLIACPKCGRKQMLSNKVCFECGTPLDTKPASSDTSSAVVPVRDVNS